MKKTKIVSTLGPSSFHVDVIAKLINAGVNVFRFNFSHGSHAQHLHTYGLVKKAEQKTGKKVGIDCDTKGAEIRTTANQGGKTFSYKQGDEFKIAMDATGQKESTPNVIQSTYTGLFNDVKMGEHVLFDDGILDTIVIAKDNSKHVLTVKVQNSAQLGSRKTIDIPNSIVHLPGVTKKDADDIRFSCEHLHINFITASFLRSPKDVKTIDKILREENMTYVKVLPKLENQQGIDNLKGIMEYADGVMVPRGDMAVNIPFENVPLVQKHMIHYCNRIGKPVIVATQMEASMAQNPRPSRAEVSDCEDAVWDGTDATMLSGETAAGNWPVHAVKAMAKNDMRAENHYAEYGYPRPKFESGDEVEALAHSATLEATDLGIKKIVAYSKDGHLAQMFSKYHPNADVLALVPNERVQGSLMVDWGVTPIATKTPNSSASTLDKAKRVAETFGAKSGQEILVVSDDTLASRIVRL